MIKELLKKLLKKIFSKDKQCKGCGTVKIISKKGIVSYFTYPGTEPCEECSKHVTIVKDIRGF